MYFSKKPAPETGEVRERLSTEVHAQAVSKIVTLR